MSKNKKLIEWNEVTWYSRFLALVVFILALILGFYIGKQYQDVENLLQTPVQAATIVEKPVANVIFVCLQQEAIHAVFYKNLVKLDLSDGRHLSLAQTISASGARYANSSESFVFWNKGNTAFVTEGATTTYQNCATPNK